VGPQNGNDDTKEDQLITKQSRYCLTAVMRSYKKQFSDAQGMDDPTFDDEQLA
jgi:hypothetical protein